MKNRCVRFLLTLIDELENRLPENAKILIMMNRLSISECLKTNKQPIIELAKLFFEDAEFLTKIETQWANLNLVMWIENENTINFWVEVFNYSDSTSENPYNELCELAFTVSVLPHSNAEVERLFSNMNIVKSKLRNRLLIKTVNQILNVRYGLLRIGTCYMLLQL